MGGVFEMGLVFKVFIIVMVLDLGVVMINDSFDVICFLCVVGWMIFDFYGKNCIFLVLEIFIYLFNIGIVKMMLVIGVDC